MNTQIKTHIIDTCCEVCKCKYDVVQNTKMRVSLLCQEQEKEKKDFDVFCSKWAGGKTSKQIISEWV